MCLLSNRAACVGWVLPHACVRCVYLPSRVLILNAPKIFPTIFNMFRPFLAEETRNKACH